jgi:parallel beta-helix repeat protein
MYKNIELLYKSLLDAVRKPIQWCLSLSMALMLVSPYAWSATYYVDTQGNDAASGTTIATPLKTIQKAINKVVSGDTIYVRGGVYREEVNVNRGAGTEGNMLRIHAYQEEVPIIRGSDRVTGWVLHQGKIWKKTDWTHNSQQVFVGGNDGPSLQQIGMPAIHYNAFHYKNPVGHDVSSMVANSFYYDPHTKTLYIWLADGADPNTKMVEASTKRRLMFMSVPYVHLKGFAFRHSNASAFSQMGAAIELSSNSLLERCDVQYTDFTGISMGYLQTGAQAINSISSNNGNSGIVAPGSYNFRVSNVQMKNNNTRGFNALWHAGGLKATTKAYGIVEYNEVSYNKGSGIWFDYANSGKPIIIRNNYIHDNGPVDSAIFFEVSNNGLIYNNVIANNQRRGIYISASDKTRVYNNTIFGTGVYAGIELGGMPRTAATLTGNEIHNNIISHGTSRYDLAIAVPNGTSIAGNTSNHNNYFRESGAVQLYMGAMFNSVDSFSKSTGLENNGVSQNPAFISIGSDSNARTAKDYGLSANSPLIDLGRAVSGVQWDYANIPRPQGAQYDIGAFESEGSANLSDKDSSAPIISIIYPPPNTVIAKGSVLTIIATATDNVGVKAMSAYVDGGSNVRSTSSQILLSWDSSGARIGTHAIYISASDEKNNLGKQYLNFQVK